MEEQFARTELLLGKESIENFSKKRIAVFGIGGVGGYTVEALVRSGIGTLDLIDHDTVSLSNLNRQIIATHSTVGQRKVDVAKQRALDINPDITVNVYPVFYSPDTAGQFQYSQYDYIVDAMDTVTAKLELVEQANLSGVPIISCMGAGNKMDPTAMEIADISETSVCPLARIMRKELRKRGIDTLKVVYSKEPPIAVSPHVPEKEEGNEETKGQTSHRHIPGSNAFVPAVAGLVMAGEVIHDLLDSET